MLPRCSIRGIRTALLTVLFTGMWTVAIEAQTYPEKLYDALEWTNVGPARGGRSTGGAGSDARPLEYYFGATGGGLWKTTDGGTTWRPVTDGQITSADPSSPRIGGGRPRRIVFQELKVVAGFGSNGLP